MRQYLLNDISSNDIRPKLGLLLMINRELHIRFDWHQDRSMTLDDLELL